MPSLFQKGVLNYAQLLAILQLEQHYFCSVLHPPESKVNKLVRPPSGISLKNDKNVNRGYFQYSAPLHAR